MRPMANAIAAGAQRTLRVHWQGRSGRIYDLLAERFDSFSMREADLYVIAKGGLALWVGSSEELVADPASRTRFRLALDMGTAAYRLEAPGDRAAARWDLEGGMPVSGATAQAA